MTPSRNRKDTSTKAPGQPPNGVYPKMSWEEYFSLDALNSSTLKLFRRSPAHARQEMLHPRESSPAQVLGTAIHSAILEPKDFLERYVVPPAGDRRTKKWKAAMAEFEKEHAGKDFLRQEEMDICTGILASALKHPTLQDILKARGMNEVSLVWDDSESGLVCKGRQDMIREWAGWTWVMDIKSCQSAERDSFRRDIYNFGYHNQAAFYLDGLSSLRGPHERRHLLIPVEKEPPFALALYELEPEAIQQGRAENRMRMATYKRCKKTGDWPGYHEEVQAIGLPGWAKMEDPNDV